ncbi:MAG TPA: hypothetical protein VFZ53_23225, partial [Polyangiaceae bacterium]
VMGYRNRAVFRAGLLLTVALGMLVPATYDSFLWNRLRYLWPFMAAWFVGVASVAELAGVLAARLGHSERLRLLVSGLAVGGLVSRLGWTLEDLGTSANAIRLQQTSLGRWARDALPKDALIGVNDTGAIAYFSGRRTFDVCGLTTASEARYWVAGAGSRFEHYERLEPARRPTHFVVYPSWFAVPPLLGEYLTQRSVPGATILGGETMVAHVASYRTLGTGALPRLDGPCTVRDELDVADLESEAAHGYDLLGATQATNLVLEQDGAADGGRSERSIERFTLSLVPGGRVVTRVAGGGTSALELVTGGETLGRKSVPTDGWHELAWTLPAGARAGRTPVELRVHGGKVTTLHYWVLEACGPT